MAGPSLGWLSTGFPSLQELGGMPAPAQGQQAIVLGGAPPAAPPLLAPVATPAPAAGPAPVPPPAAGPPRPNPYVEAPPPEPAAFGPVDDRPLGPVERPAPPPKQPPPPMPADVQFRGVGGGVLPAHEAPTRGPVQNALLMGSYEEPLRAGEQIKLRSAIEAQHEADAYESMAADALKRQEAVQVAGMRRQAELDRLAQDYEAQIQSLGQMHLDSNRAWAQKSTGDKITTTLLVALGGLASLGDPHGQNLAYNAVMKEIDQDVEAQKFDYMAGLDRAKGAQTAYALAMERYGQEDAATAAARSAALDYAAMKTAQIGAQWKGTESANAADEFIAKLRADRERTAAAGLQFVPAKAAGGGYKMYIRGQEVPGVVSEKQAQEYAVKYGVEPGQRIDEEMVKGGIQASIKQGEHDAKAKDFAVNMPNGEVVHAPNEAEAKELRELTVSSREVSRLVSRAKQIRDDATFRASPEARAELRQIQSQLITHYGVQNKLGALSDSDRDLALAGTADLFNFGNGVEKTLNAYNQKAVQKVTDRVSTYPGAPAKSSGKMPSSFTAHGGK
jgi:hypothetical protein